MPDRYGMGEDDEPLDDDTGDTGDDGGDFGGGGEEDGAGEDPLVAKVMASKQMMDLMDKVNQIFEAVSGGGEGAAGVGAPGGAGLDAPGGAPPMGGDMGGGMDAPGGAPPMGAPGGGGMGGGPEEDAAMFHGAPPVKFDQGMGGDAMDYSASGFGGPTSTNVAGTGFGGGKRSKPFSRNGHANKTGGQNMNGTRTRGQQPTPAQQQQGGNPELIRMRRQLQDMARKLARADAEKIVAGLKNEGIVFGDEGDPDSAKKEEIQQVEFLATLDEQGRAWRVADIRRNYKRRETNPAHPGAFGPLSQFARGGPETQPGTGGEDPNDFDPKTPQEAMEFAEARARLGPEKAVAYMRSRNGKRVR